MLVTKPLLKSSMTFLRWELTAVTPLINPLVKYKRHNHMFKCYH